ncbi:DUF928 domain-containing protein [Aerosakkonemataceae cyanobacterium BLCC-F154]|uniref:DUF928 domain-containing protein n=1 Tax=Floridaenema fluviatile BLCC-F154 TaxID=3153640 RepID=A0ABV4YKU0_9CYAN
MLKQRFSSHLIPLTLLLIGKFFIITPLPTPGQTITNQSSSSPWEIDSSSVYEPPPDIGSPGRRESGGNRPGEISTQLKCPNDLQVPHPPLTALVPKVQEQTANSRQKVSQLIGLTLKSHPTFFVYLPQTSAPTVEFILNDSEEREVYRTNFPTPKFPGIFGFKLPENAPALDVGKSYQWYFVVRCDPANRKRDLVVEGWIWRTQLLPTIRKQIEKAELRDRAILLRQYKIWYDALADLAELHYSSPQNSPVTAEWGELLRSAGLSEISEQILTTP